MNEFKDINGNTYIFNGGNPLPNSPDSWDHAKQIENDLNEKSIYIEWKFDCGFKLDYDGPIVQISSRFYPPAHYYGPHWDGEVELLFLDDTLASKHFEYETLAELAKNVKLYVDELIQKIGNILIGGFEE
jgi:hypothetical protein